MDQTWHYPLVDRGDGRVEMICPHGVGHPEKDLSSKWDDKWMGIHGCDGCCCQAVYHLAHLKHKEAQS